MTLPLTFDVIGRPQPAGSKRAFQNKTTGRISVVDAAKGSGEWKQQVARAALEAREQAGFTLLDRGTPVALDVTFIVQRPASHTGTGRNAGVLKESAPSYPTSKPDATKLLRAVEDALTSVLYADDSQVVKQTVRKDYGLPERAVVKVWSLA